MSAFVTLISVDGERFSVEKSVLKEGSAYFGAGLSERWDGGKRCVHRPLFRLKLIF